MPLVPTVMPKEESKPNPLGTPGIHVPDNASEIKEFGEVRNVDAKELNAKLQAQDEAKTHATPGIQVPENAKDIKAFSEVRNENAKDLNAKLSK